MNHPKTWWGTFPDYEENSFPDRPIYVGDPIPDPNRVGDFPLKKLHELLYNPCKLTTIDNSYPWRFVPQEKTVWFNQIDGGQKFMLELAGYSKEEVSVKIINGTLLVEKKKLPYLIDCAQEYKIPSPTTLDLERFSAKMENGLLEISFPPIGKMSPKTIKIL